MVYIPHHLFRVEGVFRQGSTVYETWTNSIRLAPTMPTPLGEMEWLETIAVPAATAFYSQSWLSAQVDVVALKFNAIGADGRYADEGETHALYEGDFAPFGGTSSASTEPQRALAVSWTTAVTRGRGSKGRIYLPGFNPPVQVDLRLSLADTEPVELAAETYLEALNSDVGGYGVIIASGAGTGINRAVTGARVGRVVDTIRRRRRSLTENYVS